MHDGHLLNVQQNNLILLKTYDADFDNITRKFTD